MSELNGDQFSHTHSKACRWQCESGIAATCIALKKDGRVGNAKYPNAVASDHAVGCESSFNKGVSSELKWHRQTEAVESTACVSADSFAHELAACVAADGANEVVQQVLAETEFAAAASQGGAAH